jgi:hypothetical protein
MSGENVRQKVLMRDGYCCRNCGEGGASNVHVHHVVPLAQGGNDTASNAVTLCERCHERAHGRSEGEMADHSEMISAGIQRKQETDEYHHGPAPMGFEKRDGQLVEGDDYHRVCAVLEDVARGEKSKRQAARDLDVSRRTVQRAVEERADLYGL